MAQGRSSSWLAIMPTLMLPVLLGLSVYFVLIGAIDRKLIDDELLTRYITGHPVSKVTTAMFLVGMAALLLSASEVMDQFRSLGKISLHEKRRSSKRKRLQSKRLNSETELGTEVATESVANESVEPQTIESNPDFSSMEVGQKVQLLQERLFEHPRRLQKYYLWQRLLSALSYVKQHNTAGGLDDELKYISDTDGDRKHERYSLVRILIWATPMLGFLGTVLGISEALGGIAVGPDNDFQSMMAGLQSSLYIAFDTTALALTLSIILMFCQFISDRFETQLLIAVDEQTRLQMNQFFTIEFEREDEHLKAIRAMGEQLMVATENLVEQQCSMWGNSVRSAQSAWIESLDVAKNNANEQLTGALENSARMLANEVTESISKADKTLDHRIKQWQTSLSELARNLTEQHQKLSDETEFVLDAASQFKGIETLQGDMLDFVKALPDSQEFSKATDRLASAIHVLEDRLTQTIEAQQHLVDRVDLQIDARGTVESGEHEVAESVSVPDKMLPQETALLESTPEPPRITNEITLEQHIAQQQQAGERIISLESLKIVLPDDIDHQRAA